MRLGGRGRAPRASARLSVAIVTPQCAALGLAAASSTTAASTSYGNYYAWLFGNFSTCNCCPPTGPEPPFCSAGELAAFAAACGRCDGAAPVLSSVAAECGDGCVVYIGTQSGTGTCGNCLRDRQSATPYCGVVASCTAAACSGSEMSTFSARCGACSNYIVFGAIGPCGNCMQAQAPTKTYSEVVAICSQPQPPRCTQPEIDVFAQYCGACASFQPVLSSIAPQCGDGCVVYIGTDSGIGPCGRCLRDRQSATPYTGVVDACSQPACNGDEGAAFSARCGACATYAASLNSVSAFCVPGGACSNYIVFGAIGLCGFCMQGQAPTQPYAGVVAACSAPQPPLCDANEAAGFAAACGACAGQGTLSSVAAICGNGCVGFINSDVGSACHQCLQQQQSQHDYDGVVTACMGPRPPACNAAQIDGLATACSPCDGYAPALSSIAALCGDGCVVYIGTDSGAGTCGNCLRGSQTSLSYNDLFDACAAQPQCSAGELSTFDTRCGACGSYETRLSDIAALCGSDCVTFLAGSGTLGGLTPPCGPCLSQLQSQTGYNGVVAACTTPQPQCDAGQISGLATACGPCDGYAPALSSIAALCGDGCVVYIGTDSGAGLCGQCLRSQQFTQSYNGVVAACGNNAQCTPTEAAEFASHCGGCDGYYNVPNVLSNFAVDCRSCNTAPACISCCSNFIAGGPLGLGGLNVTCGNCIAQQQSQQPYAGVVFECSKPRPRSECARGARDCMPLDEGCVPGKSCAPLICASCIQDNQVPCFEFPQSVRVPADIFCDPDVYGSGPLMLLWWVRSRTNDWAWARIDEGSYWTPLLRVLVFPGGALQDGARFCAFTHLGGLFIFLFWLVMLTIGTFAFLLPTLGRFVGLLGEEVRFFYDARNRAELARLRAELAGRVTTAAVGTE